MTYLVFDFRTGDFVQINHVVTAMEIVALTAIITSPAPISKTHVYNAVKKLSKGLPKQRSFLHETLRHLWVVGCVIDNDNIFTPTLKGRDTLERLLPGTVKA